MVNIFERQRHQNVSSAEGAEAHRTHGFEMTQADEVISDILGVVMHGEFPRQHLLWNGFSFAHLKVEC